MRSNILNYHAPHSSMSLVNSKLGKINLPVKYTYHNGVHQWNYNGMCDGNTAKAIEDVIKGFMVIYGEN